MTEGKMLVYNGTDVSSILHRINELNHQILDKVKQGIVSSC